jgi:hypothetical protein
LLAEHTGERRRDGSPDQDAHNQCDQRRPDPADAPAVTREQCGRDQENNHAVEKIHGGQCAVWSPVRAHRAAGSRARNPKAKAKRASATQAKALREFQGSIEHFSDELAHLDDVLRRAVRDEGIEELQPAQAIVNLAVSISGDSSFARIAGLSLTLRATHAALSDAIKNLEDTPK